MRRLLLLSVLMFALSTLIGCATRHKVARHEGDIQELKKSQERDQTGFEKIVEALTKMIGLDQKQQKDVATLEKRVQELEGRHDASHGYDYASPNQQRARRVNSREEWREDFERRQSFILTSDAFDGIDENRRSELIAEYKKDLESGRSNVLWTAIEALGVLKARSAVPALLELLSNGGTRSRWLSARALGRIGDEAAILYLIEALSDRSTDTRRYSAQSLAMLTGEEYGASQQEWWVWWNSQKDKLQPSEEEQKAGTD